MVQLKEGVIAEKKAPRAYQSEILRVCQQRNAIVRLDTGMGKTFIAIMLIRWLASLPRTDDEHRIYVFLVPTVALVDQQSEAIANQTPLRVRPYRGDMSVDFWNTEKWTQEFAETDCVVMTAEIWKNVLLHSYWSLDKVALMIFDECHHAQKNHPYNKIMQKYHRYKAERSPGQPLPHILGLTASPVFNPQNPEEQFSELEANLDANLINIKQTKQEAGGYILRPKERAIQYSSHGTHQTETDFEAMLDELELWDLVDGNKVKSRIDNIKNTLGNLACDVYIMNWLQSLCDPTATKQSLREIRKSGRIPEVERLYQAMQKKLEKMRYYSLGDVSDKVKSLVTLLAGYKEKKGFHAIIFVEQRHHAQALAMILGKSQVLQTFVRAMHFVGHGATGAERLTSEGMLAKVQRRTVQDFREGKLNVLVSTSVGEEGLDFQACNLIVRFDFMPTYKGYIQSRGRARKKDSEFVVMLDRDNPGDALRWQRFVGAEQQLDGIYDEREAEDDPNEPELENTPRYTVPTTGAVLTYGSAIALLDEVCSLIPTDAYSPPSHPRYERNDWAGDLFSCKVFLPMMPLLPPEERELQGPEVATKKGSKQAVAYQACIKLHKYGMLNDHLLPLREGKGDLARDADDALVDRTILPMHLDVEIANVFGNIWADTKPAVWLNEVHIKGPKGSVDRFALICAARLDLQAPLAMHEPGRKFEVRVTSLRRCVWRDTERYERLAKLDRFTRWVIKQTINRKLIQGPLVYLIAPMRETSAGTHDIDWRVVEKPFNPIDSLDQLAEGNLVLAPWQFMRKHIFTIHQIRKDLHSNNMPRITGLTRKGRIYDRTASFGHALIALLDYEGVDIAGLNFEEEMLHLKPWFSLRNNLNPIKAHSTSERAATTPKQAGPKYAERDAVMEGKEGSVHPPTEVNDEEEFSLQPWDLPDWKWRQYYTKQHEIDEEADDMLDPEDSTAPLQPLPPGKTTATCRDVSNAFVLPWSLCKISNIAIGVWNAFSWLPSLLRGINDQARTQYAMQEMRLPTLEFPLVNQALTLPMCCTGKDYQTLETIGDSALKLAVTVVVYNRFSAKDEGGLSIRRMNSIDNQHLRMKAMKVGLHRHLFTEFMRVRTWVPPTLENGTMSADGLSINKTIPRRALSDCIESLLGAAYLSGGFEAVLQTGDALGLCFGGSTPWHERYNLSDALRQLPVGPILLPLEEILGYKFKYGQLLTQAVTHRSFSGASTHCQEREEFLGDAVLDNYVIDRLSRRFPTATPSHLTRLRSVLVSNSALGYLALKYMGLHKYILHSTPLLTQHFQRALWEAQQLVHIDFVSEIWLYDPPKPAADALEGIIGSIFIDCGWRVEPVFDVLDRLFEGLFQLLPYKESAPRDPTSRLRLYLQHKQCREIDIKAEPRPDLELPARVKVTWHGQEVSYIQHHSQASAKQLAAKVAFSHIRGLDNDAFRAVCKCKDDMKQRVELLAGWKKDIVADLRANKDILCEAQVDRAQEFIQEDLGIHEQALQDATELALEKVMLASFGYNPDLPSENEDTSEATENETVSDMGEEQPAANAAGPAPTSAAMIDLAGWEDARSASSTLTAEYHTPVSKATEDILMGTDDEDEDDSDDMLLVRSD